MISTSCLRISTSSRATSSIRCGSAPLRRTRGRKLRACASAVRGPRGMCAILHRVGVSAQIGEVFRAVATGEGLAPWWIRGAHNGPDNARIVIVPLPRDPFEFRLRLIEERPSYTVVWKVVQAFHPEGDATTLHFDLREGEGETVVLFAHRGWKNESEIMHHTSTKWAYFLLSLKSLFEHGKGTPFPDVVPISRWG